MVIRTVGRVEDETRTTGRADAVAASGVLRGVSATGEGEDLCGELVLVDEAAEEIASTDPIEQHDISLG